MRAKLECHYSFKDLLAKRGLKDLEIGWVLAHLSIYNFDLDQTRYVGKVLHADSEGKSKWLWLKNQLNIEAKKIGASKTFTEAIQDCIDWKKLWTVCEKNIGLICIKLPDHSVEGNHYLFLCGPNKKCPEPINCWEFNTEGTPEIKLEANPHLKKTNQIATKAPIPKKYINQSEKQIQDWGTLQKAISDLS